jgi:anaerobic ribonucleoside-triphosphate reductase
MYVEVKYQHRGKKGNYIDVKLKAKKGVSKKEILKDIFIDQFGGQAKLDRHIPTNVFSWDKESRLAFFCGMIDADGYVNNSGNVTRIQIGSTNKELAIQQMVLAQTLGLSAKMYSNHYNSKDKSKIRYRIETQCSFEMLKYLASNKKKEKLDKENSMICPEYVKIKSIEKIEYDKESYDVETESGKFYVSGIISSNCRTRLSGTEQDTLRTGNMQWFTLNLPRLAYQAKGKDDVLFELLDDKLKMISEALIIKGQLVEESLHKHNLMPFLTQDFEGEEYYKFDKATRTFGFNGLNEMLKYHTGQGIVKDESLGLKVIEYIREYADNMKKETGLNWTVTQTPAESTASRFARLDYQHYKDESSQIFGNQVALGELYYTNSSHVNVDEDITMGDKVKIESKFHPLCNGGHIMNFWSMDRFDDVDIIEAVTKKIMNTQTGYWTYTKNMTFCNDCGYKQFGINDSCKCGSHNVDAFSRITGYLQNVSNWNEAKKKELQDRKIVKGIL